MNNLEELDSWPSEFAGRFDGMGSLFLEEEYGADVRVCFLHTGDLEASETFFEELANRSAEAGKEGFLLVVDGNLTTAGRIELNAKWKSHCLAVTGNVVCRHLLAGSYSYVSVAGDLSVEGAVVSRMMSDCGIVVGGTTQAEYVLQGEHAAHQLNASDDALFVHKVSELVKESNWLTNKFADALDAGENPFTESLEAVKLAAQG